MVYNHIYITIYIYIYNKNTEHRMREQHYTLYIILLSLITHTLNAQTTPPPDANPTSEYYGARIQIPTSTLMDLVLNKSDEYSQNIPPLLLPKISNKSTKWLGQGLELKNIAAKGFYFSVKTMKNLDGGILSITGEGNGFILDFTFDWTFELLGMHAVLGTGSCLIRSKNFQLFQNYNPAPKPQNPKTPKPQNPKTPKSKPQNPKTPITRGNPKTPG